VVERLSDELPPVAHRIIVEARSGVVILEGLVPSEAVQRRLHVVVLCHARRIRCVRPASCPAGS
jgi:hypothetical protein